jgi:hypothetical protein
MEVCEDNRCVTTFTVVMGKVALLIPVTRETGLVIPVNGSPLGLNL